MYCIDFVSKYQWIKIREVTNDCYTKETGNIFSSIVCDTHTKKEIQFIIQFLLRCYENDPDYFIYESQ